MNRLGLMVTILAVAVSSAATAQSPIYPTARVGSGFQAQHYNFGGPALDGVTQFAIPFFAGVPIGQRFFFDISGSYVTTEMTAADGQRTELDGITDTKIRGSYTLGRDVAVISLSLSIPTGEETVDPNQSAIISSIGQNFLSFPVTTYGTGFGVTGGLAIAQNLGAWNVGLAGSLRVLSDYEPLATPSGTLADEYSPGVEGRVRLGLDRLIGERARLTAGLTFSSFGTDEITGGSPFSFRSGSRFTGELGFLQQLGTRSALQLYTWAYTRGSGSLDTGDPVLDAADAGEQVYHQGALFSLAAGSVMILPGFENRFWVKAGDYSGRISGFRLGFRLPVGPAVMLATEGRFDDGWLQTVDLGYAPVTGFSGTLFLQVAR